MKRKILTILLALVMTLISITCGAAAETATVTDGKLVNIEFTKNADTIITPEAIENEDGTKTYQATIDPDTWFAGLPDSYGSGIFGTEGFGGLDSNWVAGKIDNGFMTFNERVYYTETDADNNSTVKALDTGKKYNIPFSLAENETKSLDSYVLSTTAPYGDNKTAPNTLKVDLKQTYSSSLYLVTNSRAQAGFKSTVAYTDGTSEVIDINVVCNSQFMYTEAHTKKFDNVTVEKHEDGNVEIKGKTNDLKGRVVGYLATYNNYTYTTDALTSEGTRATIAKLDSSKGNGGFVLYEVRIDKAKIPESITFTKNNQYPNAIYSIAQQELTNAEMMEVVEKAEKIDEGIYSENDIALIEKANNYAVTLEARNYDHDFSAVKKMAVNAQKQAKIGGTSNIDFSDKFNADTVIEKAGETLNPQTWFAGLEVNYSQYGGVAKFANSEGKIAIKEIVYNTAESKTEETGSSISMDYTEKNGLDSVVLSNKGTKSFKTDLDNVPSSSLYVLTKFEAGGTQKAVVEYSDGTSDTIEYKGSRYAQAMYNDPSDAKSHAAQKDAGGNITWAHDNYRIFGYGFTGYDFYKCETDTETGTSIASKVGSNTIGLHLYELKLDESKTPVSVTIENGSDYHVVIYSIAQKKLEYTGMLQALLSAENLKVTDENFSYMAHQAINYKAFLADCGIISESDYAYVDSFAIQISSEDNNYVDLKDYVDTDLFVPPSGEVDESFNGRLSETWAKDGYYNGGAVPADGILTMSAPSDETSIYGKETGNTFKLSGSYTGMGADAVKVKKGESVTIEFPKALDGYKKGVSVILDFISGEANNQTGIYEADVKVNYTDGTSEDVKVKLFNASLYQGINVYPHYATNMGRRGIGEDNKFYYSTKAGFNDLYIYSSEVPCNLGKKIQSMTFSNNLNDEYHIFAISEYTYSNYELANSDASALENDITFANRDEIVKAATAALESDRRGINTLSEEAKTKAENALNSATEFANNISGKIYSKYSVSNGTATVTLANHGFRMRSFTLIFASYNADGSLKAINVESVSLKAGEYDVEKQISVSEGDSYMLFVWDSVGGMKPVATQYPY